MQENKIIPTHELYYEHLTQINGIDFTHRKIDIIACFINSKRPNEIAHFLSISKKTVSTYTNQITDKCGASTREQVVDFVKRSDKFNFIKDKYLPNLLIRVKFEEQLRKISQLIRGETAFCYETNRQTQKDIGYFVNQIKNHLNQAGISVRSRTTEGYKPLGEVMPNLKDKNRDYSIYIFPKNLIGSFKQEVNIDNLTRLILRTNSHSGEVIFFPEDKEIILKEKQHAQQILFLEKENYYFSILEILQKIYPQINVNLYVEELKEIFRKTSFPEENSSHKFNKNILESIFISHLLKKRNNRLWILGTFGLSLCFLSWIFLNVNGHTTKKTDQNSKVQEQHSIRSDLPLPLEANLLIRSQILAKIEEKLRAPQGVQTISLLGIVGIGGSGKTTIVRQFGRSQKLPLVWEINATTKDSLISSFKDLAYRLAKTREQKNELSFIYTIKNSQEMEKQLFYFVKERLKGMSNWLLIYDNVETLTSIKDYFPHDPTVWGSGKVIFTTRDSNIKNNIYLTSEHIIEMKGLNKPEILMLFSKILFNCESEKLSKKEQEEALNFLQNIPPFPLDMVTAAHYLKQTGISYAKYLEHLHKNTEDFISTQKNFLEDSGEYVKTRYGIITLSLQHIMEVHKDFGELLLFISLLDSQNIPQDLLSILKNDVIVERFIYHLKKYSLINFESSETPEFIACISLHRSTQEIIFTYLVKILDLKKNNFLINRIAGKFENYLSYIIDIEDYLRMRLTVSHCEKFLSNNYFLTSLIKEKITAESGCLYYYLSNYGKAQQILENSLITLNQYKNKDYLGLVRLLSHLGYIYREHGHFEKAATVLEQSITIYKKHLSKNHIGFAHSLAYLGLIYRNLNRYEKAKILLTHSLDMYKKYFPKNYRGIARVLAYLGMLYRDIGVYEEARSFFDQSISIYQIYLPNNYADKAWTLLQLGNVYKSQGHYEKARIILEEAQTIYSEYFSEAHSEMPWVLSRLGIVYTELAYYDKAKNLLERALSLHQAHHQPDNPVAIAYTLTGLGIFYIELANYDKAKDYLEKAREIYMHQLGADSTGNAWVLLHLGIIEKELSNYKKANIFLEKSLSIYHKIYGEDHIETAYVLKALGQVYTLEGEVGKAEKLINKALRIFQQHNHPKRFSALESLAELYLKKAVKIKEDVEQSQNFKNHAIELLKQALAIVKTDFPINSPHIVRLESKIVDLNKNIIH
ncbi:tetratricopeptide repeat protein [Candidatus Paracaedibacter symbiosus]|uniref:tetratricopeptide repeat protein n=1 Tax=Candidatus Paracaedibacter symbiosus TaxID=244582 RepID=UPI0005095242|nr:tetratricopeptide repeat protein [Candidatus Paracaedibacter symbiosus]